jgi:uncharacterized protein YjbI with pentapeptide repeats
MDRDEALKLFRAGKWGILDWNGRRYAGDEIPNLSGVTLRGATLRKANFSGADLSEADLTGANFSEADLSRADLRGAILNRANLSEANLNGADLSGAIPNRADLSEANLSECTCFGTTFGMLDLSGAIGLDTVHHLAPSTIGIDTLFLSHGKIPDAFLRGCGAPEALISYLQSLIGALSPIHFCS